MIVGAGYVQALVTGPFDVGCPPRIHRAGRCVHTPARCGAAPECLTRLEVLDARGELLAAADSSFVRLGRLPRRVTHSAIEGDDLELEWSPSGSNDQICALWTWRGDRELCCVEDRGGAGFAVSPDIDSVRLSRGRLRAVVETSGGTVEIYQSADTAELLR